jgi:hypothetical protein
LAMAGGSVLPGWGHLPAIAVHDLFHFACFISLAHIFSNLNED